MDLERGLVRTPGGYVHYRSAGSGAAILLFHINQQSSALYQELMERLAGSLRAIAIDLPGHGMSDPAVGQPSIADYAQAALAVMDALDIRTFHLLGEALGGIIAVDLAARSPDRVDHVVVLNCPYVPGGTPRDTGANVTPDQRPSDSSGFPLTRTIEYVLEHDAVHAPMHPTQSWMDRVNRAHMEVGRDRWQGLKALHAFDLKTAASAVKRPVLALYGEHFYFTPSRHDLTVLFSDVKVTVLNDARFCLGWERAEDVARHVQRFVAKGGRG